MISRARFSLTTLLLLTTVVAGGMAVWRGFIYEPPTHKIPLYERAPGTRGGSIEVGPNRIGFRLIARNDRDGSIHYDNKRISSAKPGETDEKALATPAKWLDVVQIELDPGPEIIDIIEVRIFDHERRELLPHLSDDYGWRQIGPNSIQLFGLGKSLPGKLDVWFRAHSYATEDAVEVLAPTVGATRNLPGGKFTLRDIREGSWSYRSGEGLNQLQGDREHRTTALLEWHADPDGREFQIIAVTKSGERLHVDGGPHYFTFRSGRREEAPIDFRAPLNQIDHFEIRPFGGRHVFFFEAVESPKISSQPFVPPPKAIVDVSGKEVERVLTEFAPFEITVATHRGQWATGTSAGGLWASVTPAEQVTDQDQSFTFTYHGAGLRAFAPNFTFFEVGTKKSLTLAELKNRANGTARGAAVDAGYRYFQTPLERIDSIEVTIGQ